jgi:hypothetical protein
LSTGKTLLTPGISCFTASSGELVADMPECGRKTSVSPERVFGVRAGGEILRKETGKMVAMTLTKEGEVT